MCRSTLYRWLLFFTLGLSTVMSACTSPTIQQSPGTTTATKQTIAFSVYDLQQQYFQDMEKGTREAVQAAGYNYELVDEKDSATTMVSSAMKLINQGVNALIISPFQPNDLGPVVDAAHKKGIPVVIDDIGGGNSDYDAIVVSDNEKGGIIAADEMNTLIKSKAGASKDVLSITCEPDAVYAARRNAGFESEMKALGYHIVASVDGDSLQANGYKIARQMMAAHPDISGIFACNDPMAVGAAQALASMGISGSKDVFVIGFNGDQIALNAIKSGLMSATIQQVPENMGEESVALATQLLNKQPLQFDSPASREILVPVNLITAADLTS
jgi:ribose transport system substrate-binding protein